MKSISESVKAENKHVTAPVLILILSLFFIGGCKRENSHLIKMVSVPELEYISNKSVGKDSIQKTRISLESFFVSNEITNKEFREFTDWVKNNPDQNLVRSKELWMGKDEITGKTRVYTVPVIVSMTDLLPHLIDSSAMYKLNKNLKNYFTDKTYDDYPVVGVSKNAAEYYCNWLTSFEFVYSTKGHGKNKQYIAGGPETNFRLPLELEWDYISNQPIKGTVTGDNKIRKVDSGSQNRWGISHLSDNVSEWVVPSADTLAVSRGGSWRTRSGIVDRQIYNQDSCNGYTGFRIVRTFTPVKVNYAKK